MMIRFTNLECLKIANDILINYCYLTSTAFECAKLLKIANDIYWYIFVASCDFHIETQMKILICLFYS